MIDIKRIVENEEEVKQALLKRMDSVDFSGVIKDYQEKVSILKEVETKKANKNKLAKEVGLLKRDGKDASNLIKEMSDANTFIEDADEKVKTLDKRIYDFLISLPNIPDDDVVAGDKENNEVVRVIGEKPEFNFAFKDHVELAKDLDLVDHERGVKLGGNGFWVYKNLGARLEWALINYFIDFHTKNNYEFLLPPHILNEESGYAAGQFPKFREDVFNVDTGSFLIPTAETAIINYHRDEILDGKTLPLRYFAYTPCYRKEAGSHRTSERGTVRGHQFNKVEMFALTDEESSPKMLEELINNAETLVKNLGLHYRVSKLAAKDTSASMVKTFDIEVWIPSMNEYKEVSSVSNARDFQARRGMIRYKDSDNKTKYVHTLNGSGLATSRLLPAILEQFQNEDGSVTIPEVLRPYFNGVEVLK